MNIGNILLSASAIGSLYLFAKSSERLELYWFHYKYMPVSQRPKYKYLNKPYLSIWSEHALITMLYWYQCYKLLNATKPLIKDV